MRLDTYLVEKGLAKSRARAQALIKEGNVKVASITKKLKPSLDIGDAPEVTLLEKDHPYVSRAAFKLIALIEATGLELRGKVVMDIGASTGGFTQVALEEKAKHVYAVDVGHDQLSAQFKDDPAVTSLEKTDARDLTRKHIKKAPQVLFCDVSFISCTKILPHVIATYPEIKEVAVLVKPQFELTRQDIGAGGVVKNKGKNYEALEKVQACLQGLGFETPTYIKSPVKAEKGNQEFMLHGRIPVQEEG